MNTVGGLFILKPPKLKGILGSKEIDPELGFNSPVILMSFKRLHIFMTEWWDFRDSESLIRRLEICSRKLRWCTSTNKELIYLPAIPNQSSGMPLALRPVWYILGTNCSPIESKEIYHTPIVNINSWLETGTWVPRYGTARPGKWSREPVGRKQDNKGANRWRAEYCRGENVYSQT